MHRLFSPKVGHGVGFKITPQFPEMDVVDDLRMHNNKSTENQMENALLGGHSENASRMFKTSAYGRQRPKTGKTYSKRQHQEEIHIDLGIPQDSDDSSMRERAFIDNLKQSYHTK